MSRAATWGQSLFYQVFVGFRGSVLVWGCLVFGVDTPALLVGFNVASVALLLFAERWIPHREEWTVRDDPQVANDIGHSIVYVLTTGPVLNLLAVSTLIALAGSSETRLWRGVWPDHWPLGLQIAALILIADFLEYWLHRWTHTVGWLWPFHVLHHTPDRLHVLKTLRQHWTYPALRGGLVLFPLLALGVPLGLLLWAPIALLVVGSISHANLEIRTPRWLHRVINTPELHRIHHSLDPTQGQANYCLVFPVWDLLFGTYRAPERERVMQTGVLDDPVPDSFWKQLALPFTLRSNGRTKRSIPTERFSWAAK